MSANAVAVTQDDTFSTTEEAPPRRSSSRHSSSSSQNPNSQVPRIIPELPVGAATTNSYSNQAQTIPTSASSSTISSQMHSGMQKRVQREVRFGAYILGSTLGEGEFGKVKLGWRKDGKYPSQVAIKLVKRSTIVKDSDSEVKIHREINSLKLLNHPNIVNLVEVMKSGKYVGIVLEYASGGELFDYILQHKYLKEPVAKKIFAQLVSGVDYMHSKGLIHRDLKLENLLLDKHKNVIISDFGFVNSCGDRGNDLMKTSCGSPCYAAPELVLTQNPYEGRKADIWSLGVILYAMLSGYLPFDDDPENEDGSDIIKLYHYICKTPLTFPEYVSPLARDLLRKIIVSDPRKRIAIDSIRNHPFLSSFTTLLSIRQPEWDRIYREKHAATTASVAAAALAEQQTPVYNKRFSMINTPTSSSSLMGPSMYHHQQVSHLQPQSGRPQPTASDHARSYSSTSISLLYASPSMSTANTPRPVDSSDSVNVSKTPSPKKPSSVSPTRGHQKSASISNSASSASFALKSMVNDESVSRATNNSANYANSSTISTIVESPTKPTGTLSGSNAVPAPTLPPITKLLPPKEFAKLPPAAKKPRPTSYHPSSMTSSLISPSPVTISYKDIIKFPATTSNISYSNSMTQYISTSPPKEAVMTDSRPASSRRNSVVTHVHVNGVLSKDNLPGHNGHSGYNLSPENKRNSVLSYLEDKIEALDLSESIHHSPTKSNKSVEKVEVGEPIDKVMPTELASNEEEDKETPSEVAKSQDESTVTASSPEENQATSVEQEGKMVENSNDDELKPEVVEEKLPEPMEEYIEKPAQTTQDYLPRTREVPSRAPETKHPKPDDVNRRSSTTRRTVSDENKENREHKETKKRNRFSLLSFYSSYHSSSSNVSLPTAKDGSNVPSTNATNSLAPTPLSRETNRSDTPATTVSSSSASASVPKPKTKTRKVLEPTNEANINKKDSKRVHSNASNGTGHNSSKHHSIAAPGSSGSGTNSAPKESSAARKVMDFFKRRNKPEASEHLPSGSSQTFIRDGIEVEIQPYQEDSQPTQRDQKADTPLDESLESTILSEIQQGQYICLVCTGEIDQDSTVWACQECFRVYDLDCILDWAVRGSSTNKTNRTWRCPACNHETKVLPKKFTCWCGKVKNPAKNPLMPFSCGSLCNYKYPDCIHRCLNTCHPGKHPVCGASGPVMKCHCGKEKKQLPCIITPYKKGWKCDSPCGKKVCDLNHKCAKGCHGGSCGKCQKKVEYKCYCGDTKLKTKCHKRKPVQCSDHNGKKWIGGGSCGKVKKYYYDCGEHYETFACQPPPKMDHSKCKYSPDVISTCYCGSTKVDSSNRTKCTDSVAECANQVALERERAKKKAVRNNLRRTLRDDIMLIEAVHICTQTCNRLKACGQHQCQAMCHSGPCEVCLESTSEDLVCNCGKTVIPAPVRCGTELVCHEQCTRPTACGHRPEPHECHNDDVPCPKCTVLVKKTCECGARSDLPGIMCSQERVSCGKMCMAPKECGHPCLRTCSSKCTKDNVHVHANQCMVKCQKVRKNCPHLCKLKCHFDKVGKSSNCDAVKCNEPVIVQCECGNLQKNVPCGASINDPTAIGAILECNESCAAAKRDAKLREAFAVNVPEDEKIIYSDYVLNTFTKQAKWCTRIENVIRTFLEDYNYQISQGIESPKKSYHFPPMTSPQRQFIHELAQSFKLYTESQDQEPKRSVFIVITRLTFVPASTIQDCLHIVEMKQRQQLQVESMTQEQLDDALYNAIVIQDTFFGITKEDLQNALRKYHQIDDDVGFTISWLKESTFILYDPTWFQRMDQEFESMLKELCDMFRKTLRQNSLAFDCKLCLIDPSVNFVMKIDRKRRDDDVSNQDGIGKKNESQNSFDILQSDEELAIQG
ncbi:FAP1 [Candida margitis]|uniref:FAP1 n=1 Tax=Candida margitis TaxID=1775924 RepID=UPI0022271403|nr:FAP1 [Candida margitis]KAI5969309.1 FAP1 [Candida margitis]